MVVLISIHFVLVQNFYWKMDGMLNEHAFSCEEWATQALFYIKFHLK